jgi:hypothetical protein
VAFDVVNQKWCVELDDQDDDGHYLIAYDAVREYSNKQHSTFNRYQLPSELVIDGDDEIEIETEDSTLYSLTPTNDWSRVNDDEDGERLIDPIERMGGDEEFYVNIIDAEINTLKDEKGEIRYEKVFEWALPRFGDGDDEQCLFEFQAARMRNYMRKRIVEDGWTPKYYTGDRVITGDHVTRFYGACLAKMFMGNRSINQIFCTREIFNAVPSIQGGFRLVLRTSKPLHNETDRRARLGASLQQAVCSEVPFCARILALCPAQIITIPTIHMGAIECKLAMCMVGIVII